MILTKARNDELCSHQLRRVFPIALLLASGCFGPSRIRPPHLDPEWSGRQAIATYDLDGDGRLVGSELTDCPGLKQALPKYDADGDGGISSDEIAARMQSWLDSRIGLVEASCFVHFAGRPLEGAYVGLTPEPFMGSGLKMASGVSGPDGLAVIYMPVEDLPDGVRSGMAFGVYKVSVTHPEVTIPDRYNTATELGIEVGVDYDVYNPTRFDMRK